MKHGGKNFSVIFSFHEEAFLACFHPLFCVVKTTDWPYTFLRLHKRKIRLWKVVIVRFLNKPNYWHSFGVNGRGVA
jgi:hypothetical protein